MLILSRSTPPPTRWLPHFKNAGLLDTAVVVITFDNGARAVAEALSAAYGYDVRGEVFGSEGMVTAGGGARSSAQVFTSSGWCTDTVRSDIELMRDAYTGEFARVRRGDPRMPQALRHWRRRPACARRRAGVHRVRADPHPVAVHTAGEAVA